MSYDNTDDLPEELRIVEIFTEDKQWVQIRLSEIKDGQVFRMFNNDGTPVVWDDETVFVAQGEPYITPNNNRWAINCHRQIDMEGVTPDVD